MVKNKHGFTLIEILTVVAIIGLLAVLILFGVNPATQMKKGRDGRRKAELEEVRTALEMCRVDTGSYPSSEDVSFGGSIDCNSNSYSIPNDPLFPDQTYTYTPVGDGYDLCAWLEAPVELHCVHNP